MRRQTCQRCGEEFEIPTDARRVQYLPGETGDAYTAGEESPLHRCPTLTRTEELEMLKLLREMVTTDYDAMNNEPGDE
jgi:hypothetical protein